MAAVRYQTGRFPPDDRLDWRTLIPAIGPAAAAVARYDGMLAAVPNPDVLLAPLTTQEAVLSSRIEGTEATMGDVLGFEAGQEPESAARRDDMKHRVAELTRSRYAIHALDWIFQYPIFKGAHFAARAGIPAKTARRILNLLCEGGILQTLIAGRGRRAAIFVYPAVLDVAEGREVV